MCITHAYGWVAGGDDLGRRSAALCSSEQQNLHPAHSRRLAAAQCPLHTGYESVYWFVIFNMPTYMYTYRHIDKMCLYCNSQCAGRIFYHPSFFFWYFCSRSYCNGASLASIAVAMEMCLSTVFEGRGEWAAAWRLLHLAGDPGGASRSIVRWGSFMNLIGFSLMSLVYLTW